VPLFRRRASPPDAPAGPVRTIVGSQSVVRGSLSCRGAVRVDGAIEGDLACDDGVIVGRTGSVRGDVAARLVTVAGRIGGSVTAHGKVELLAGGHVQGDIKTPRLVMNDGIAFDGKVGAEPERARLARRP